MLYLDRVPAPPLDAFIASIWYCQSQPRSSRSNAFCPSAPRS